MGATWNNGNTQGDTKLRTNLSSMVSDLTIDGRAELRAYPWGYTESSTKTDVHGPDAHKRADGPCVQGNGFTGARLKFFQIPDTAIQLKGGLGTQASAFGIFNKDNNELNCIWTHGALNDIVVDAGDSKLHAIFVVNVDHNGLTMNGSSSIVKMDHVCVPTGPR